jgi:hypothetical protein
MRNGRWTKQRDFGEGSAGQAGFPPQPDRPDVDDWLFPVMPC